MGDPTAGGGILTDSIASREQGQVMGRNPRETYIWICGQRWSASQSAAGEFVGYMASGTKAMALTTTVSLVIFAHSLKHCR